MERHKPSPETIDLLLDALRDTAYHLHKYIYEKSAVDGERNEQLRKNLVECEEKAREVMESVTGNRWGLTGEADNL